MPESGKPEQTYVQGINTARQRAGPSSTMSPAFVFELRDLVTFGRSRYRRAICRLVAAAMLFAQAIGFAQAC
ncbi:MAG: hypothetical protein ABI728_11525, partial [Betaproteobacteria bacterium]